MADTFEEAIRSLSAEDAETRPVCVIDNDLRTITTPSNFILGVYNDKDVHEILFSMPRYYNDIDLSVYSIRVNYINSAGTENDYYVESKDVLDDTIKFSWLTSRMVFSYAGEVRFSVCLRNTDEEGVITNEFNTTIASGIVLEGIEVDDHQEDPEISDLIVKITKAKDDAETAAKQSEENVTHYPKIENGKWIVYDANNDAWVDTGIAAQGPKGDTGETGAKGDTGKTPDFHIGAVYNVPYGQSATASITGTPERPILSLAIPEGARGAKGDTGATGPTGPKGDTGAIGTPLVASTASEMTDTTRLYIYVGSESGYSNGHWYHYDGTAWVDGGLYNAVAVQTDKSLSIEGMAADSAATGEAIDDLKAELNKYEEAEVISFTTGGYIVNNGNVSSVVAIDSPTASAGYAYVVANCKYNDRFIITGIGGGTPRLWAFIDKDNKMISKSDADVTGDLLVVTAPFNARKIVVNTNITYDIAYNCVKISSDYAPNLVNNGEVEINFEPSYGIRTNGATVSFGIDSNGNVTVAKETAFWYACAIIPCNIYSKVKVTGTSSANAYRLWAFVDDEGNILKASSGTETLTNFVFDIPKNAAYLILNIELDSPFSAVGFPKENTYYKFVKGYIATVSVGSAITLTPVDSSTYECISIPCVKGQKFTITGVTEDNSGKRLYAFSDLYGYCRFRYNDGQQLIGSVVEAPVNGTLVINALADYAHSVSDGYPYALREPLTTLPPAFLGSMAFKPLGALSKGYICMMTDDGYDDGTHGLVQETIPLAITKDVPFTFALMRDSDVCKDNTKLYAVIDAIENHGCSVAQHGEFVWNDKSEDFMTTFFDLEKAFFDAKGIELHGAVIPAHQTTELIKGICGGRFGVVRSGYSGIVPGTQDQSGTVTNFYNYYTSGEQSNLYCLSSYNCATATDLYNTEAIDYAFANHTILICYFHENAMDATMWQRVSDMIDYAKTKGLEFITLGDIPYLINA